MKLVAHPVLVTAVGKAAQRIGVPVSDFEVLILTMTAALPSASNVWTLAVRYKADGGRIARIILASTLLFFDHKRSGVVAGRRPMKTRSSIVIPLINGNRAGGASRRERR